EFRGASVAQCTEERVGDQRDGRTHTGDQGEDRVFLAGIQLFRVQAQQDLDGSEKAHIDAYMDNDNRGDPTWTNAFTRRLQGKWNLEGFCCAHKILTGLTREDPPSGPSSVQCLGSAIFRLAA